MQRLARIFQHRRGAIDGVVRVTRIGLGEANDHIRGSTTKVEHCRSGRPAGKGFIEQRDVGLMGFGEISRRVGARLLVRVHQLRFGNPDHWIFIWAFIDAAWAEFSRARTTGPRLRAARSGAITAVAAASRGARPHHEWGAQAHLRSPLKRG